MTTLNVERGSVELRGVSKRFDGATNAAVTQVDLSVQAGERFVIVGPSGSGKTTVLRMVAGLESPTHGTVAIDGRNTGLVAPHKRGVAMVFQQPAVYPQLSVFDNLAFGLRARGVARRERSTRVNEVADWLGLGAMLNRRPRTLSGGEIQRVAIGRAAITRPAVLLLDEPFSSLDTPLRASTRDALLDVHQRLGGTLILVTHDQTEALAVGDRIALMRSGSLEAVGTPRELYDAPPTTFVGGFLGDPSMNFLPCKIDGANIAIEPRDATSQALQLSSLRGIPSASTVLGIRPEFVDLETENAESVRCAGVVERVEMRGHEVIVLLRVAGHLIAARSAPKTALRTGDAITVSLQTDQIRFYDRMGKLCA